MVNKKSFLLRILFGINLELSGKMWEKKRKTLQTRLQGFS